MFPVLVPTASTFLTDDEAIVSFSRPVVWVAAIAPPAESVVVAAMPYLLELPPSFFADQFGSSV